jgi:hypothetical protein
MTYVTIDENTIAGKKLIAFLKTLSYVNISDTPNTITRKAIKETECGKVMRVKNVEDLFCKIGV